MAEPKPKAIGRSRKPYFRAARGVWVAEVKRPDGRTVTRTAKTEAAAASGPEWPSTPVQMACVADPGVI